MISPQQNVGQSAAAAKSLTAQQATQARTITSQREYATASPSKARALYDSMRHLSRQDALHALFAMSEAENIPIDGSDYEAFSAVIKLVGTEGEMENRKKEARIASNLLFELLEELPTATGERLALLRPEILTLGSYADQAQQRVEQLKAQASQMLADL